MNAISPSLAYCLIDAVNHPELVAQFDRLAGCNLSRRGTDLDLMIDDATGRSDADVDRFIAFVEEFIYRPLVAQGMPE
ncbi:hypothetical protein [uncultured Thiodictyon sp.]|uniref:hypothetical protein n=1 Tax=uncultured Thiodictyon sp. TaxID=1846217 RepID=UPI0025D84420|nr:hypothetical protein [uncultured Thiodictyon sp.]